MLFQRRALGRRLEILEADLALDALRGDVLCMCVSVLGKERRQARRVCKSEKKRTDLS